MSTSSSAAQRQPVPEASPFPYAEAELASGAAMPAGGNPQTAEEQNRTLQAAAFEQGRQAGQQQLRAELDSALDKNRQQITASLQQFIVERQNYYRSVEGEIVQLALAIARKILHREAQLDPRALAGIVRVTLEKLEAGTTVHLHVSPKEAADWRHYFACQMEGALAPEVHEDASMPVGECRIETSLGATEVGFQSQLKEIETGLLDLLAERPDAGSSPAPNSIVPQSGAQ